MFNQSKRNRGGRMNPGNRDKRQFNSPESNNTVQYLLKGHPIQQDSRPPRRGPINDKNMNVDGMFKNQRITHVFITLVGTFVQVQVKNGTVYEGVLKTVSPKGDIVLEMAHKSEEGGNGGTVSSAPSRDRIIDKLILKNSDVITLNASNVDLEYAVKESFTDSGISKFNGEVKEKDLKELQPWDGEPSTNDEILDDKSENGWDPHEMFQTNATQFNVKSSYDDTMSQYTTILEKQDTAEYKMREERALKLAAEIEGTEQYKQNIALENGEGESEEAMFSSVVRPEENRNNQMGSAGGPGKYIPPNKRHGGPPHGGNPNMTKQGRGNYSQQQQQQQQYPHPSNQQQHQQGYQQSNMGRNLHNHQQSGHAHGKHESNNNTNVNGDESARTNMPVSTAGPTVKTSPVTEHSAGSVDGKQEHNPQYSSTNKHETKKHNKGRDEKIQELKEFGSNFKLGDNKGKDKEKEKVNVSETKDSDSEEKDTVSLEKVQPVENPVAPPPVQSASSSPTSQEQQQQPPPPPQQQQQSPVEVESKVDVEEVGSKEDITIKSNLNPNAKEFVSQKMKQPTHQAPTPPRLHTQSPIIQPAPVMNIGAAPVYPSPGQSFIMPPNTAMVLNSNTQPQIAYNARPKRAVVSVKPDPYPAASAVTGQPLLAQHNPHTPHNPHNFMYMQPAQMMQPQPTGFNYGQMMPMPAPSNQRFVTPTSMQGPTSIQPGMDQSTPTGQPGQLYMQAPQQGPIPTHMTHGPQLNIAHFNPNNQQTTTQMNSTPHSGSGHHHPAPSPVHSNPNQQQQQQQPMNPGPHPQSSGTPQPPQGYSQPTLQNHPPLQPSPHNPTSPQTMQQMPYHSHAHHMSMQGSAGGQQFSVPQQTSMPTPVTAHTHSQHMQPQFVMMPNVAPSAQLNHHHLHGNQFQNHITGPGSMQPQLLSQPLGHPGQNHGQAPHHHNQMQHFPLQVHSAGGQNYQPAHSSLT